MGLTPKGEAAQPCCGNCSVGFALQRQKQSGNEIKALDLPAFSHGTDPSLCPHPCTVGAGWKQRRHLGREEDGSCVCWHWCKLAADACRLAGGCA